MLTANIESYAFFRTDPIKIRLPDDLARQVIVNRRPLDQFAARVGLPNPRRTLLISEDQMQLPPDQQEMCLKLGYALRLTDPLQIALIVLPECQPRELGQLIRYGMCDLANYQLQQTPWTKLGTKFRIARAMGQFMADTKQPFSLVQPR